MPSSRLMIQPEPATWSAATASGASHMRAPLEEIGGPEVKRRHAEQHDAGDQRERE
jgi:hypothetical protein